MATGGANAASSGLVRKQAEIKLNRTFLEMKRVFQFKM